MTSNDQRPAGPSPAGGATVRADGPIVESGLTAGGVDRAPSAQTVRAVDSPLAAAYAPASTVRADQTRRADGPLVPAGVGSDVGAGVLGAGVVGAGGTLRPGGMVTLGGAQYRIVRRLGRASSEAEVFLAEGARGRVAVKYYFPHIHPDAGVVAKVRGLSHPNVVGFLDAGEYDGRSYEVLEFAAGGTLLDTDAEDRPRYVPIRDENRIREIVRDADAGIAHCHAHGLIHRDIKPENMFFREEGGRTLQIADFGIAALLDEGAERHLTRQARTPTYAAPEVYVTADGLVVVGPAIDYYALGVTILHLWLGTDPFAELGEHASMSIKFEGLVALPEDMSAPLLRLVAGLLASKPRNRWGHEEVQRWLRGEFVELREQIGPQHARQYEPLPLGPIGRDGREVTVTLPHELAEALPVNRQQSIRYLYRDGFVARWIEKAGDIPLAQELRELIEVQFPSKGQDLQSRSNEAAALAKAVYLLDARTPFHTHGGAACRDCGEIADALERERSHYLGALTNRNDPLYLYLEARREKALANRLRRYALEVSASRPTSAERTFNEIVLALRGWRHLTVHGEKYESPAAIMAAPRHVRDHIAGELLTAHSMASLWLENLMHEDSAWRSRVAEWRRSGRHNWLTLSYVLDPRAPFDFFGTPVRTTTAFGAELALRMGDPEVRRELLDPASPFVEEADYWLAHYAPRDEGGVGYAEMLGRFVAEYNAALTAPERDEVRACVTRLVEARFDRGDQIGARRSGLRALAETAPDHQLVQMHRAEVDRAKGELAQRKRTLAVQANVQTGKASGEMVLAGVAAVVIPLILASLAPKSVASLPYVVAVGGMGAMGYGLFRGTQAASDEDAREAAKWNTLIPFAGALVAFWVIQFVLGVVHGGGFVSELLSLLLRTVLSVATGYALAIPSSMLIGRVRGAQGARQVSAEMLQAAPKDSTPLDEQRLVEAVTRAWQQRPSALPKAIGPAGRRAS